MAELRSGRVLQLLGPSAGGIRRHVGSLAMHLLTRGWDVEVAGPPGVMDGIMPQDHIVRVPEAASVAQAWSARSDLTPLAAGVDLIHAHGLRAGWIASTLRRRPPLVVTIHNVVLHEAAGRQARLLRVLERLLPSRVDVMVAVSADIARGFTGSRGGDRLVVVAPVGPAVLPTRDRADVRRDLGLPQDAALVVSGTARLHPQKDLGTLLRAFALVRRTHPDARLAIVGEGPERGRLEALARELQLTESVRFTGWVSNFADVLAAADVVAMSSLWEGAPIALAEAMRLARPVVATAVGAIPEVLIDRKTGRLVPPHDPDALAAAISELLDDSELAAALGEAARERVETMLDSDVLVSAVEDVYRATLDR